MTETTITPEILELILRTARVKGCKDVYSLAPRGHRVGIYFQQRRAALLAAALRSRLGVEVLKTASFGIVGAGTSGLTFLLAIENEGATDVVVYESSDRPLDRGANARHRLLHPNYNRWPLLGSMDVFTSLPALNWYAASAKKVSTVMKDDFASRPRSGETSRIFYRHAVKAVVQRSSDFARPVRISAETPNNTISADHRIVIIASGYGEERARAWGLDDYWNETRDNFDDEIHKRETTIYGTGDGGLIDAVRACAAVADDAWQLPLEMIGHIRPGQTHVIPADTLETVPLRSPVFSEIEKSIQTHEESIRCMAWASCKNDPDVAATYIAEEQAFYDACVENLRSSKPVAMGEIEALLKPVASRPDLVPLVVGQWTAPFEPTSAPINKLLLAYLLKTKRVRYEKREREQCLAELDARSKQSVMEQAKTIVVCRLGAMRNFPPARSVTPAGAASIEVTVEGFGIVAENDTETHLIDALAGTTGGEYVYFDTMPNQLIRARYGLDQELATNAMRRDNTHIVEGFAADHLDGTEVKLETAPNGCSTRWVLTTKLSDPAISERLKRLGGIDGSFLGAPIVVAPRSNANPGPF